MFRFMKDKDGLQVLVLVCDACQKPILDASTAAFVRRAPISTGEVAKDTEDTIGSPALLVHKDTCDPGVKNTSEAPTYRKWKEFGLGIAEALHFTGMEVPAAWFDDRYGRPDAPAAWGQSEE